MFMFARTMATPKHIQKDYKAFLEDILRRLLLLEKDIHILLIAHRKTVKFDFDRLLSRKDAAAIMTSLINKMADNLTTDQLAGNS